MAHKEKFAQISGQDKTECGLSLTQRRMTTFGKIERQQALLAWKILKQKRIGFVSDAFLTLIFIFAYKSKFN